MIRQRKKNKPIIDKILQQIELPRIIKIQQEKKLLAAVEQAIERGERFVRSNLFFHANIEFRFAAEQLPELLVEELEPVFNDYVQKEDHERALIIGLVLLKIQKEDYRLANTIGNCARKSKKYKQANNLYRHALKTNRNFNQAFYNLAASLAKVEKYDLEVQALVEPQVQREHFVLPSFLPHPDILHEVIDELTYAKKAHHVEQIHDLLEELEQAESSENVGEAEKIRIRIQQKQKKEISPTYNEICEKFRADARKAQRLFEKKGKSQDQLTGQQQIFNLGIYALSHYDLTLAQNCFEELRIVVPHPPYLEMVAALTLALMGQREEAVADFFRLLEKDRDDRYLNINLGLIYYKSNNRLLAYKYLLIGAGLLQQSEGLFSRAELMRLAMVNFEQGSYKKALSLFTRIVEESENGLAWQNIGEIYLQWQDYHEACNAFKEALRINPDSLLIRKKLNSMHDHFVEKADELIEESKYMVAIESLEQALTILRTPETLKKTSDAYKVVMKKAQSLNLLMEYREAVAKEKAENQESLRQQFIKKGKEYLHKQRLQPAIRCFEQAFDMKIDKDVFMYLAYIYKGLNRKQALQHLIARWQKKTAHQLWRRRRLSEKTLTDHS